MVTQGLLSKYLKIRFGNCMLNDDFAFHRLFDAVFSDFSGFNDCMQNTTEIIDCSFQFLICYSFFNLFLYQIFGNSGDLQQFKLSKFTTFILFRVFGNRLRVEIRDDEI